MRFCQGDVRFRDNVNEMRETALRTIWVFEHLQCQALVDGCAVPASIPLIRQDGWVEGVGPFRVEVERVAWVEYWFSDVPVRTARRFS